MALSNYLKLVAAELEARIKPELTSDASKFSLRACQRILIRAAQEADLCTTGHGASTEKPKGREKFALRLLETFALEHTAASDVAHGTISTALDGISKDSNVELARLADIEHAMLLKAENTYSEMWQSCLSASPTESSETTDDVRAKLESYLQQRYPAAATGRITALRWLAGGRTKQTGLVTLEGFDTLPSQLILRKDMPNTATQTSLRDEYPILEYLHASGLTIPRPYLLEETGSVLGEPFVLVDRVLGSAAADPFEGPPSASFAAELAVQMAKLHALPISPLPSLSADRHANHLTDDLISGLADAKRQWFELARVPSVTITTAFDWLDQNVREVRGDYSLIHYDIGLYNVLAHEGHLSAVLDWELTRIGHPAEDLGFLRYTFHEREMWPVFMSAYVAAGGQTFDERTLSFFTLLKGIRGANMMLYARQLIETEQSDAIPFAEAPAHFLPVLMFRLARELKIALAA